MEKQYIQELLDRYLSAETTEDEERLLADYFSTQRDIPTEWRDFSVLFRGIRQYDQKPATSHKRTIMRWSAAAAIIALVFEAVTWLKYQEQPSKPPQTIAQMTAMPGSDMTVSPHEVIEEKEPEIAEVKQTRIAPPPRPAKKSKPMIHKSNTAHIDRMLDEADMAFSLATAQCSMDIGESFTQDKKQEETDYEANIFL